MPRYRDAATKLARYQQLKAALWSDRSSFDAHWQELGSYLQPRRTRFWPGDRNKGDKRNQNIIDSTGGFACRTLQSGLHAGLTSPARPWMRLTTPDPQLAEHGPVKEWLHIVTQEMLTIFLQTNLYNVLPVVYGDMGQFGTACMGVLEDSNDLFRCYAYPIGSYAIGLDARQKVATFVREYEVTVRQIIEDYGLQPDGRTIDWSRISTPVQDLWTRGSYESPVQICWMVQPNEDHRTNKLEAKYLPFSSCTWEVGSNEGKFLRESGFRSFPILAPRWAVTGEDTYGTSCPAMDALGDIKQLQMQQKEKAKALKKAITPSLVAPTSLQTQKVSLVPGDVTYVDTRDGMQGLRSIHDIDINIEHLRGDIGETQYRIRRAFYEDLFLMIAQSDQVRGSQPITAREVEERHEEKLLALGPVLERTNDELLDPLIDRVFSMMEAAGYFDEARGGITPPRELQGVKLKVEYISVMAAAQKLVGAVGLNHFMQSTVPYFEAAPEMRDKINFDQVVDDYADVYAIDPRIVVPTAEARQVRQARAEAQKAQADAEQAKNIAQAVHAAGTTPMGEDTALSRIAGAAAGAAAA